MADDLEATLAQAAAAVREQEIMVQRCVELARRLEMTRLELGGLRERHETELEDVEKLERLSLTRVVASLRGSREDRLAAEQAEVDAVALRVQDAQSRLGALQEEHDAVQNRIDALAGAGPAYTAVLAEKEQYLNASEDPRAPRILQIAGERGGVTLELREIGEAIKAANAALWALREVQNKLGSASSWSTYDTFFGGMISSAIKHDRLDDAADAAREADRSLALLRTELADVGGAALNVEDLVFDGLTRFLDVWFDNIRSDWAVRDRIQKAQQNVADCVITVEQVQARLTHRAGEADATLTALNSERESLLTRDSL